MSYTVAGWIVRGAVVVALWLYGVRIARWRGNVATVRQSNGSMTARYGALPRRMRSHPIVDKALLAWLKRVVSLADFRRKIGPNRT